VSDLAPFVAAVLRDQVVGKLHDENKALKSQVQRLQRTLHEHNPFRSFKLTGPNGARLVKEGRFNVETTSLNAPFCLYEEGGFENVSLRKLPKLELWIDGGCSVRFGTCLFTIYSTCVKRRRKDSSSTS
jgi:hypothetical protein